MGHALCARIEQGRSRIALGGIGHGGLRMVVRLWDDQRSHHGDTRAGPAPVTRAKRSIRRGTFASASDGP